jgi:hypothetical protein
MLKLIDIFFVALHSLLVIFNLFGWICKKLRLANLVTLLMTAFSWFILGIFYGIGYCPLTEWHFMVLEKLGNKNLPASYIKYIVDRFTGYNANVRLIEVLTVVSFFLAFSISVILNLKDYKLKRKQIR